jgi:hypothetical protein
MNQDDMPFYVGNLVNWFDKSTAAQRTAGRAWYPMAGEIALVMASGDIRKGAGCIAALSTNAEWSSNLTLARHACNGAPRGMKRCLAEVERILAGEDFSKVLPYGSKRWNFAYNIVGDLDLVTIDRWAIRAAVGDDADLGSTAARKDGTSQYATNYALMTEAYRRAAEIVGETPADLQAIVWVAIRDAS